MTSERTYMVKEVFDTVQGEGSRAGARSVFVRFAGCNLWNGRPEDRAKGAGACALWCDADFAGGEKLSAPALLGRMDGLWPYEEDGAPRWCVLTGGEPMLQVDGDLVRALQDAWWRVAVETNGTLDPGVSERAADPSYWGASKQKVLDLCDHVTLSPKLGNMRPGAEERGPHATAGARGSASASGAPSSGSASSGGMRPHGAACATPCWPSASGRRCRQAHGARLPWPGCAGESSSSRSGRMSS